MSTSTKSNGRARCFWDFYGRLQDHEAEENDLIVQAYNVDIGVGD